MGFKPKAFQQIVATVAIFIVGGIAMAQTGADDSPAKIKRYLQAHYTQPVIPLEFNAQPYWGNKDASVKIVEFSDFQCPYCRLAAENLKPSIAEYRDRVALYFANFPLDSSCNPALDRPAHPFACAAAKAVLCAQEMGQFWKYHDKLFENQKKLSEDYLLDYAQQVGLDRNQMTECMRSEKTKARLDLDLALATQVKVQGTPTVLVNGRKVGPWSNKRILRAVIEEELKRTNK